MYTLDIKKTRKRYLIAFIITFIVSMVYEYFSHDVISIYMISSSLIPLGGLVLLLILNKIGLLSKYLHLILNSFIAILTICFIIIGVLEIYGTTNNLISIYDYLLLFYIGLFLGSLIINIINKVRNK